MKRSAAIDKKNTNNATTVVGAVVNDTKQSQSNLIAGGASLRAWQWRVFVTLYVGFVAYTVSKRSLGFAAPKAIAANELTAQLVGQLSTALSTAFAVGKLFGGILCDLYNPIVLMALGLALSGLAALGLASAESAAIMLACWTVNGFAQSPAWPPVALLMTRWFADHERASWWAVMSSAQTAGSAIAAVFITRVADYSGSWRVAMSAAGTLAVATSLVIVPLLALSPAAVGLQLVDAQGKPVAAPASSASAAASAQKLPLRDILLIAAKSRSVWLYSLSSMALYFVKEAIATWFLVAMLARGVESTHSAMFMVAFEAAGVPGCIVSAVVSSRVFGNRRSTTAFAFAFPIAAAVLLLAQLSGDSSTIVYLVAMATIGFSINAIQTMVGMGYVEENDKRCSGTISGIVGSASYFGAAMAGSPLAAHVTADIYSGFFLPMLVASATVALFLIFVPSRASQQR
jgi:OPA family sugar phosphate sensor protein UhpC-like MFS transporter